MTLHPDPLERTYDEIARDRKAKHKINGHADLNRYWLMKRDVLIQQLRFLEDELMDAGQITKRVTKARRT